MENKDEKENLQEKTKKKGLKKGWKIALTIVSSLVVCTGAFFGGFFTYASKLDEGTKSLLWAKELIQKEYKYDVSDEEFYSAVFDGINGILDPYSEYMSADEYAANVEEGEGKWYGLGLQFSTLDKDGNDRCTVMRVTGNSPAWKAGLREGAEIVGFGNSEEEISDCCKYQALYDFMQSKGENEAFVLRIAESKGGAEKIYTLKKERFVESYVFYRSNTTAYCYTGTNGSERTAYEGKIESLDDDTAYIRLMQFNGNAAETFDDAMSVFKAENKKNLVLDLRCNGGGYMNILCSIAKYFCKNGEGANPSVVRAVYKNGAKTDFLATDNRYYDYFSSQSKIAVLADNGTASASECLIGCMVDYGSLSYENIYLSERVAQKTENGVSIRYSEWKTYGKGIMQSYFVKNPFGKSESLKLTTAEVVWPVSEKCIHGVGVTSADGAKKIAENFAQEGEIYAAIDDFLQKP